jgi:hypothetical protein
MDLLRLEQEVEQRHLEISGDFVAGPVVTHERGNPPERAALTAFISRATGEVPLGRNTRTCHAADHG